MRFWLFGSYRNGGPRRIHSPRRHQVLTVAGRHDVAYESQPAALPARRVLRRTRSRRPGIFGLSAPRGPAGRFSSTSSLRLWVLDWVPSGRRSSSIRATEDWHHGRGRCERICEHEPVFLICPFVARTQVWRNESYESPPMMPSMGGTSLIGLGRPATPASLNLSALTGLARRGRDRTARPGLTLHSPVPTGAGADGFRAAIRRGLAIKGTTDPVARANWEAGMMVVGDRESDFNNTAVNSEDRNAAAGNPSVGTLQFTRTTFEAYHEHRVASHESWRNLTIDDGVMADPPDL